MIDVVAKSLYVAEKQLNEAQIPYTVIVTRPTRHISDLSENCFYVIRQQFNNGVYHLVAAAKMGRESFKC
ncbi:hypothetical protein [Pelosinus propionicus]|uniref:Uncharacterized protein n=1 Tax=Pelosinus propionicus DSM 13327 TaxID=1123291 RepID=A0A1I4K2D7_9FIRM|nr:hypothetical protein [Pelosinus propionicus]SFL72693.1 hypothetical protein SAMN04490355_101556 [Pelosinus propionicus DSM 13327]